MPRELVTASAAEGVSALEVAGNGYINVRLDRGGYGYGAATRGGRKPRRPPARSSSSTPTSIPIKPRTSDICGTPILGDTFVRMLRASGRNVEVQNYIDNTGVQVADVVAGFHHLEQKTPADVEKLLADPDVRFDYIVLGSLCPHFELLQRSARDLKWRLETLHAIEDGIGDLAELADLVADAIVECHLATMRRLGIEYDVLPRESEILHLKFWATAFEQLKERQAIYFETEGKNKGCWVMPAPRFPRTDRRGRRRQQSHRALEWHGDLRRQGHRLSALEIRPAGQGLLLSPVADVPDGHAVWVTTAEPQPVRPQFGKADARIQRDRFAAVVFAGRSSGGAARAGLSTSRRTVHPFFLRDGGAVAANLRRDGHRAVGRRQAEAVCRGIRAQGTGREGRRPDRQTDREGAGRGGLRDIRKRRRKNAARWRPRLRSARCAISC